MSGEPAPLGRSHPGLRDHGDRQVPDGALDLAVNVRPGPPDWLRARLVAAVGDLAGYPDPTAGVEVAAARHGRRLDEVLLLNGAAEGFWLLPALRPAHAVCVHPEFTEGEAALRAAGVEVTRVPRRREDGWLLDPDRVPDDADLVVLGRPGNPTGAMDPVGTLAALCRQGRTVVVDEAFADFLPDASGLGGVEDLPGLVCLRSCTKLWGLAGLRVGYLVGPAPVVSRLAAARQPWSVSTPALTALLAVLGAEGQRRELADEVAHERTFLLQALADVEGVEVTASPANYALLRTHLADLRARLLDRGVAVRRGETFPTLDARHVRVAVRDPSVSERFVAALREALDAGA